MVKRFTPPPFWGKILRLTSVLMISVFVSRQIVLANESTVRVHILNQQTVTGSVTSASGPVAAVTVSVSENPAVSTQTDENGNFSLPAKNGDVLRSEERRVGKEGRARWLK